MKSIQILKNFIKHQVFEVILFWRRNKDRYFFISFEKFIPKAHINEHYETLVKWILRTLVVIGIISAIFSFNVWYLNLLLALFLLGLEQLLEKSIFVYFSLYVSAIPEYRPEDWKGMMWAFDNNPQTPYLEVGVFFSTREAAERIFPIIKRWSKEGVEDRTNLLQISIILDNSDGYHVYLYPNTESDPDYLAWKEKMEEGKQNKEHKPTFLSIMLCKSFRYSTSAFPEFQRRYREGLPYAVWAYVLENNQPVKLEHLGHVKKTHLKIKNISDLRRTDREYEHAGFILNPEKHAGEPSPEETRFFSFIRRY